MIERIKRELATIETVIEPAVDVFMPVDTTISLDIYDAITPEQLRALGHALIAAADAGEREPYVPKETYKYDAASNRMRRLLGGIPQDD